MPSHAWNRWRYHYPQAAFPYDNLRAENSRRNKHQPEYELLDTGVFDSDRYWITEVHYAKAEPTDLLMTISVTNAGPDADAVHVLPTAWFRNTWSWDVGVAKPVMEATGASAVRVGHPFLGTLELIAGDGPDGAAPTLLFCENETNISRLYGAGLGASHQTGWTGVIAGLIRRRYNSLPSRGKLGPAADHQEGSTGSLRPASD